MVRLADTDAGALMAEAAEPDLRALGLALLDVAGRPPAETREFFGDRPVHPGMDWGVQERLDDILTALQRRKLAWTLADAQKALDLAAAGPANWRARVRIRFALAVTECATASADVQPLRAAIQRLHRAIGGSANLPAGDRAALYQRAARLLGDGPEGWQTALTDVDPWAREVKVRLAQLQVGDLGGLLRHLAAAKAKPAKKWTTTSSGLVEDPAIREAIRVLVEEIARHERQARQVQYGPSTYVVAADLLDGPNAEVARGAIWAASLTGEAWVLPSLRDTALFCATSRAGGGTARSEKLANACVGALAIVGGDEAVTGLAWLQTRVKNRAIRKQLDRALSDVAAATGITASQLLERTVPTFGLDSGGERAVMLGEHEAVLRVDDDILKLSFRSAAGRTLASTPAAVKEQHGSELSELKAVVKEAKKALPAERSRLEGLLATDRTWPVADWEQLYLRHPVTGSFARRLLWEFTTDNDRVTLLPGREDEHLGGDGKHYATPPGSSVRLWHPSRHTAADIAEWRSLLVDREIHQPFKQAFREVYRLTPAELETAVYSNRFAAHILRYPQANALIRARGWNAHALGYWDGGYNGEAIRDFPDAGVRAVFYYDLVEQADIDGYGTPALCSTDQVRFEHLEGRVWQRTALTDVPPLAFSEAMRDVDLFVGVASIAADPGWTDRGADRRFDGYWRDFSFGNLTESAISRRAALERLIPRTKIAARCTLTDRYLVVRGDLRTYKIHIGSGNILMEPDDTYLCIVPARRTDITEKLFLPFEEDGGRLSLIISKAFLLADDKNITDSTILRQLRLR